MQAMPHKQMSRPRRSRQKSRAESETSTEAARYSGGQLTRARPVSAMPHKNARDQTTSGGIGSVRGGYSKSLNKSPNSRFQTSSSGTNDISLKSTDSLSTKARTGTCGISFSNSSIFEAIVPISSSL